MNTSTRRKLLGVERIPRLGIRHRGRRAWKAYENLRSREIAAEKAERERQRGHAQRSGR